MDFLNRAFAQLADLFRSMTPAARLTAALLLVVSVVSLAYLFNQQVSGPDAYLMGGQMFSASQLRDMEAALGKAGLEATVEGARIKVPRGQESKYMAALAEANALPTDFGEYLLKAVSGNSYLANRVQQEAALKIARNRELQKMINALDGVDNSAVLIDEKTERDLFAKKIVTASVSVQPKGTQPLDGSLAKTIRNLVAASVAGLKPEAITVTDLRSGRSYAGNGGDAKNSNLSGDYAESKKHLQHMYEESIHRVLSYIPGVIVTTNVELDAELSNEEVSTEYDAKSVVYESREVEGNKATDSAGSGGRPGLVAQGGVANQGAAVTTSSVAKNTDETRQTEQRKAVPTVQKRIVRAGSRPSRVTVSVAIPSTYYEEIWRKMNPPTPGQPDKKPDNQALADLQNEEQKKIEDAILTIIPIYDRTADAYPQVKVSTFPVLPSGPLPEPTVQDNALAWLGQYWSTLGMTGLALVSLVMLRSMVKSIPVSSSTPTMASVLETPATLSLPAETAADADEIAENTPRNRLKRRAVGGPSLRDELADIVKEDPESAVSILRTWIGNAS